MISAKDAGNELGDSLYREFIIDHYQNPRNFGELKDADSSSYDYNPTCGDELKIQLKTEKGKIKEIKFSGRGCAISIAAASMLTEEMKGRPLEEISRLDKDHIIAMLGIDISPARIKCATLGMVVLKKAADSMMRK